MLDVDDQRSPERPASGSMVDSLRRTVMFGLMGWTLIVLVPAATSDSTVAFGVLAALHVLTLPFLAWGLSGVRGAAIALAVVIGVTIVDLKAASSLDEPIALATVWTMNALFLGSSLIARGWKAVIGAALTVTCLSSATLLFRPVWDDLLLSTPTTGFLIVVATGFLIRYLYRYADRADDEMAAAALARDQMLVSRAASQEAADASRTMHDTVINTLAAIASGGAATHDPELVRERCTRDLSALAHLADGHRPEEDEPTLTRIGEGAAIAVHRRGLADEALRQAEDRLPATALRALRGAADEAVRNAERHAGVDQVLVEVSATDATHGLRVTISDAGAGFDGAPPPGHGIAESVIGRVRDVGGEAHVSSRAGHGTSVTLSWAETDRPAVVESDDEDEAVAAVVAGMRETACWAWAAGVVVVGVAIDAVNRPGIWTLNYVACALVAVLTVASWLLVRRGGLPRAWTVVVIGMIPVIFTLTYLAVRDEPVGWLALTVTPLLVSLFVLVRSRVALWAGVGALLGTAVVTASRSPHAAGILVIGTVVPLGLMAGWFVFYRIIERIARQAEHARRAAASDRVESEAQAMMRAARSRWQLAGLTEALDVLRSIAAGEADPRDETVRSSADAEERFLRQVMMLSPETVHLGPVLARALAEARAGGVELIVRTGELDAPDPDAAQVLGGLVLDSVAHAPAGSRLTAGLFGDTSRGRLLLVGSRAVTLHAVPPTWELREQHLADQTMLEVSWPRRSDPRSL